MRRRWWVALGAGLLLFLAGVQVTAFSDLISHWANPALQALRARGVVAGFPDGSFRPDEPVTRAQLARLLTIALGQEHHLAAVSGVPGRYMDVPVDHWAAAAIEVSSELGLLYGYPDGRFAPEAHLTRQELAVVAVRAAGLQAEVAAAGDRPLPFVDWTDVGPWASPSVWVADREGLLPAEADHRYRPRRPATRLEAALVSMRLLARQGALYHLTGAVVRQDLQARTLQVRDEHGRLHDLRIAPDAVVLRDGAAAAFGQFRAGDQIWVVQDSTGAVIMAETHFQAYLARELGVAGARSVYMRRDGHRLRDAVAVEPGAPVFVNGRAATVADLHGAQIAYVVVNAASGEARAIDAVRYDLLGTVAYSSLQQLLLVNERGTETWVAVAPDVQIFRSGLRQSAGHVLTGDRVMVALEEGQAYFVQVVE